MMGTMTVTMPGRFDGFFSGSSVGQGQTERYSDNPQSQAGAERLFESYRTATVRRQGRGYSKILAGLTPWAVAVLADYAGSCIDANSDEPDHAELAAARTMLARCREALWCERCGCPVHKPCMCSKDCDHTATGASR